jgi:trehalose synthase
VRDGSDPTARREFEPREISVAPRDLGRYRSLIRPDRFTELQTGVLEAAGSLRSRTLWNVNSTEVGGGVAEMLHGIVGYASGVGVDARWMVIEGDPAFFAVTKRIHNRLHGLEGDDGDLGEKERSHYESISEENGRAFSGRISAGDVVFLHDPQTAGLAPRLTDQGAIVLWRCHVGADLTNHWTEEAWAFLRPYLDRCRELVFSRSSFAPDWIREEERAVVAPSIDPFSPKNRRMSTRGVLERITRLGLLAGTDDARPPGSAGRRAGRVRTAAPELSASTPLVVQISRWDRLKDMGGVLEAFATSVALRNEAHLALVGPEVDGVADDPESAEILAECMAAWEGLPPTVRKRIHIVSLDMHDVDENALMVNALQRFAAVVAQKSLAEGFGLTVAEGMWKAKPVVASAVGGIVDQITDGTGVLLHDPLDLDAFSRSVALLIDDRALRVGMGRLARRRIRDHFVGDRHLLALAALIVRVTAEGAGP